MANWVYANYVLAVGQGTGTLVQVCDGSLDRPVWNAIIDLGSEGWKKKVGEPSAVLAAEKLKKSSAQPGGDVTLDSIILSHSDNDHTNLLKTLLEQFSCPRDPVAGKPTLWVKKVWYGGDWRSYQKVKTPAGKEKNLIERLNEYRPFTPDDKEIVESPPDNSSGLDDTAPDTLANSHRESTIWLMAGNTVPSSVSFDGNTPTRKPDAGYLTNTVSLVVGVTFSETSQRKRIIATGDATALTLVRCLEAIRASGSNLSGSLSVTLPHHGSSTTTYDVRGMGGPHGTEELAAKIIAEFTKELSPMSLSASAGERKSYRHPAIRVICDFGTYVGEKDYEDPLFKGKREHFYTAHFAAHEFGFNHTVTNWPSSSNWYSARTTKNVFTTDYVMVDSKEPIPIAWPWQATYRPETASSYAKPPPTASWLFVVGNGGADCLVERLIDGADLDERQQRWVEEAIGGPLPAERFVHIPSADARDRR